MDTHVTHVALPPGPDTAVCFAVCSTFGVQPHSTYSNRILGLDCGGKHQLWNSEKAVQAILLLTQGGELQVNE